MTDEEFKEKAEEYVKAFTDRSHIWSNDKLMQLQLREAFKNGAKFGYNKANEWHYVKDGDLPNTETKNYIYIRRRKRYERQFTDYRVIKCFVLCLNEKGKTTAEVGYFNCNQKCFLDEPEGMVYAWKEIVLPEESE